MFTVQAVRMADAQSANNPDTLLYRFDWPTPVAHGAWGAHHLLEVPFAFDQLDNPQARGFVGVDPPRTLADATHTAWASFIAGGDPNHDRLPNWPRYDAATRPTMLFDEPCHLERLPADDEIALWDGVI